MNDLRAVLNIEATALLEVGDGVIEAMDWAVKVIYPRLGPIIVTGIGKSGHVARKAASTFTSTGHKALFLHPSEASHGDMGLVNADATIIALSNSGETSELSDVLVYAKRNGIPVIGITSSPDSTLARASTVCIDYGAVDEACPNGLAPTTSTTLCMAICDALAVVLSKSINFTPADFRAWHPGGSLGARLRMVSEIMNRDFAIVSPAASMPEVARAMGSGVLGVALVKHRKRVVGIITDGDIRRNLGGSGDKWAKDSMSAEPLAIDAHEPVDAAIELMNKTRVTSLVVEEHGVAVGIVHLHEALNSA